MKAILTLATLLTAFSPVAVEAARKVAQSDNSFATAVIKANSSLSNWKFAYETAAGEVNLGVNDYASDAGREFSRRFLLNPPKAFKGCIAQAVQEIQRIDQSLENLSYINLSIHPRQPSSAKLEIRHNGLKPGKKTASQDNCIGGFSVDSEGDGDCKNYFAYATCEVVAP